MSPHVVSFHYTLTERNGDVLASSEGHKPLTILEGAGQIPPGLEAGLKGLKAGEKKKIKLSQKDAFGARDEKRVMEVPRSDLPKKDLQIGDAFNSSEDPNGLPLRVVKVAGDNVTLDGNHPLAGKDLTFDVEVTDVRAATKDEIEHGHAHGPGGHHHH